MGTLGEAEQSASFWFLELVTTFCAPLTTLTTLTPLNSLRRDALRSSPSLVQKKDNAHKVAENSDIDQQMPHEVVISKPLLCVEYCANGVADATCANQRKKWGRGVVPKKRKEDYNHPTHYEVNSKAD